MFADELLTLLTLLTVSGVPGEKTLYTFDDSHANLNGMVGHTFHVESGSKEPSGAPDTRIYDHYKQSGIHNPSYDKANSLTTTFLTELLEYFTSKLSSGKPIVVFLDWDRTITMTEGGFDGYSCVGDEHNYPYFMETLKEPMFDHDKFIQQELQGHDYDMLEILLKKYAELNSKDDVILDTWKVPTLEPEDIPLYMMGGLERGHAWAELFNLAPSHNIRFVIVTNSRIGNLLDEHGSTTFMRYVLDQIGVTPKANALVNIVHAGSTPKREGAFSKQEFVSAIAGSRIERPELPKKFMPDLKQLQLLRVWQIQEFIYNPPH